MVVSQYLYKYPYRLIWHLLRFFKKNLNVVVYCAEPLDYLILQPVLKYLPEFLVVVKNSKTANYLQTRGIPVSRLPCFPNAVIMCRHAAHKFPEPKIIKIGLRHGAYHFKAFARTRYYNDFHRYFMTSQQEVEEAKARGISNARAVGFPKLDPMFDGSITEKDLQQARQKAKIDRNKKTIIFTATWDRSGMSAIDKWIDEIDEFAESYNVLVTVHPWTTKQFIHRLKNYKDIFFIDDVDVLPYLMIADVLIGDTSSIIAEFCALDKPIITFKVPATRRTDDEITRLLKDISIQVENIDQLKSAVLHCLENPGERSEQRKLANKRMFDRLDGQAGKRAAAVIKKILRDKKIILESEDEGFKNQSHSART